MAERPAPEAAGRRRAAVLHGRATVFYYYMRYDLRHPGRRAPAAPAAVP